jgi:large subunit ribosomal protein L35
MGYKIKPNKSMKARFKVTKTGKLKAHHAKTSHLRSRRTSKLKRRLGRAGVIFEGNARNFRRFMGVGHLHPAKVAHKRALAAKAEPAAA